MYQKADITSFATVRTLPMLPSAMELTEILSNIITNRTEDFMRSGEKHFFTLDLCTCIGTGTRDYRIYSMSLIIF